MILTDAQKRFIYVVLTIISGPAINILARQLHWTDAEATPWLNLLSALTTALGVGWGITSLTPAGIVQASASLTPQQQREALDKVSDAAKILVAKAVPDVATVVVKNTASDGPARLANDPAQPDIVTEAKNEADAKRGTNGAKP